MTELIWRSGLLFVVTLGLVPLVGGLLLWQVMKFAKVGEFSFPSCWKAFLTGSCFAYLLLIAFQQIFGGTSELIAVRLVIFLVATVLVVPWMLGDTSRRTWLVVGIAVSVIDAVVLGMAIGLFELTKEPVKPPRHAPPAGPSELPKDQT
jgi:hypothetical protein